MKGYVEERLVRVAGGAESRKYAINCSFILIVVHCFEYLESAVSAQVSIWGHRSPFLPLSLT